MLVPLWINSERIDKIMIRRSEVQKVAEQWVSDVGRSVVVRPARSEDRNWVDRRAGPEGNPQRCDRAQELPPIELLAGRRDIVEL